jgi:DNA-binding NtrC family response regulator
MGQATIVVVDDTDYVREVIGLMLDHSVYTVYSFADPNEAVVASENFQVDLFLLDMDMPVMNGLELLKRLKVRDKTFEVIIITGKNDKSAAVAAMKLGAYGVLLKPFSYNELHTFVEYALASAAAKKQQAGTIANQSEKR